MNFINFHFSEEKKFFFSFLALTFERYFYLIQSPWFSDFHQHVGYAAQFSLACIVSDKHVVILGFFPLLSQYFFLPSCLIPLPLLLSLPFYIFLPARLQKFLFIFSLKFDCNVCFCLCLWVLCFCSFVFFFFCTRDWLLSFINFGKHVTLPARHTSSTPVFSFYYTLTIFPPFFEAGFCPSTPTHTHIYFFDFFLQFCLVVLIRLKRNPSIFPSFFFFPSMFYSFSFHLFAETSSVIHCFH